MRSRKNRGIREFDIVSFIDLIFVLVIFGVVTTGIEVGIGGQGHDIPKSRTGMTIRIGDGDSIMSDNHTSNIWLICDSTDSTYVSLPRGWLASNSNYEVWRGTNEIKSLCDSINVMAHRHSFKCKTIVIECAHSTPLLLLDMIMYACGRVRDIVDINIVCRTIGKEIL